MTPPPYFDTVAPSRRRGEGFAEDAGAGETYRGSFEKRGATGVSQKEGSPNHPTLRKSSREIGSLKRGGVVRQNKGEG